MTATGKKGGMRLITVVMNVDNTENRSKDTIAMMDYGFNMYSLEKLVEKGKVLGDIKINLGKNKYENIVAMKDVTILNNNQYDKRNVTYDIITDSVSAPLKVGDEVGKLNVYEDGNFMYSIPLTVMNDVNKANMFTVFIRNLKDILSINL